MRLMVGQTEKGKSIAIDLSASDEQLEEHLEQYEEKTRKAQDTNQAEGFGAAI